MKIFNINGKVNIKVKNTQKERVCETITMMDGVTGLQGKVGYQRYMNIRAVVNRMLREKSTDCLSTACGLMVYRGKISPQNY